MKPVLLLLVVALSVGPLSLFAEQPEKDSSSRSGDASSGNGSAVISSQQSSPEAVPPAGTLGATMESVSSLGFQFQIVAGLNRYMDLRNGFDLLVWHKWITYNGFHAPASISVGSINPSLDFYPFPSHGLRFSPGILIHTPLIATSNVALSPQDGPFTLNGDSYMGRQSAHAYERLQSRYTGFTMTTGWGNMIPRKKAGPWSFPVELGVGFFGEPSVESGGISGTVCDSQGNCVSSGDGLGLTPAEIQKQMPALLSDLKASFGPYRNRVQVLKTYPIISFGLAYSFCWYAPRY